MSSEIRSIDERCDEVRNNLIAEIQELEEKIESLQDSNQPYFFQSQKLEQKRLELQNVQAFIDSRK